MIHCCPNGYRCSSGGYCRRNNRKLTWSSKMAAQPVETKFDSTPDEVESQRLRVADVVNEMPQVAQNLLVEAEGDQNVVCPGGRYRCPYGNTCCPHAGGGYGCCPRPHVSSSCLLIILSHVHTEDPIENEIQ